MSNLDRYAQTSTPPSRDNLSRYAQPENTEKSWDIDTVEVLGNISDSEINKLISNVVKKFNGNKKLEFYTQGIQNLSNLDLNEQTKIDLSELLQSILDLNDPSKILFIVSKIQELTAGYQTETKQVVIKTREQEQVAREDQMELAELDNKYFEDFGENWDKIKETWNIKTREDYAMLEKIVDLGGGIGYMILDTSFDILQYLAIEGVFSLGLVPLYDTLSFALEKDGELYAYLYEQGNFVAIFMLTYIHINAGLVGYRYLRGFLTVRYGQEINKMKPKKVQKKKVEEGGKTRTETIEEDPFLKKWLGARYLDAVDHKSNIFSLNDGMDTLSADQNEYLKRRKTMDILKTYYFDDPVLYKRLKKIEVRFLQDDSITYWREIHFLIKEHGLARRITGGLLKAEPNFYGPNIIIGKTELEQATISLRQDLQKGHFEAIERLYKTSQTDEGSINVDTNSETDFLKGIRGSIMSNPHISSNERKSRLARLDGYLNRITGQTLVDEDRMMQELMRIESGDMTKIAMLDAIRKEIREAKVGGTVSKIGSNLRDRIFLRKKALKKLEKRVAKGDWNGTPDEFKELLKRIKTGRIRIPIPVQKRKFSDSAVFIRDVEKNTSIIETNEKLYSADSIKGLENYIKYKLPNADEEVQKKIFDAFKDLKTPYNEVDFYRELQRIEQGYLPSNTLLEELEKVKTDLERDQKAITKKEKGFLSKIASLRITIENDHLPYIKQAQQVKLGESLTGVMFQAREGNYATALQECSKLLGRFGEHIEMLLKEILESLKSLKGLRIKSISPKSPDRTIIDEKISSVDTLLGHAQQGDLNMRKGELDKIKPNNILDFDVSGHVAQSFDEADKDTVKERLREMKDMHNHDFRDTLEKSGTITEIEESLRSQKTFGQEIDLMVVSNEMTGKDHEELKRSISELTASIKTNRYTIGQVRQIMGEIHAGEKFSSIDIEYIISNTSDHQTPYDGKSGLLDDVSKMFDSLESDSKQKIILFIQNNRISKESLPQNLKNFLELEEMRVTQGPEYDQDINADKAEISRLQSELASATSPERLAGVQKEFNEYMKEEGRRGKPELAGFIADFDTEYKTAESRIQDEARTQAEAREKAELEKHKKTLEAKIIAIQRRSGERLEALGEEFDRYIIENNLEGKDGIADIQTRFDEALVLRKQAIFDASPEGQKRLEEKEIRESRQRVNDVLNTVENEIRVKYGDNSGGALAILSDFRKNILSDEGLEDLGRKVSLTDENALFTYYRGEFNLPLIATNDTNTQAPENREGIDSRKKLENYLDKLYTSVRINGNENFVREFEKEYTEIYKRGYLDSVLQSESILEYYKEKFPGIDLFVVDDTNFGKFTPLQERLKGLEGFEGISKFSDIGKAVKGITDDSILGNIRQILQDFRVRK